MGASYNASTMFTLRADGYESGSKRVVSANKQIQQSQQNVTKTSAQMGTKMGKATSFVSQLGYGVEDFVLGSQTGGLAGGLRGAANNMSMMAMAVGGAAGAFAALATVIGVTVVPALSKLARGNSVMEGMSDRVKGFVGKLQEASQGLKNLHDRQDKMQDFKSIGSVDGINDSIKSSQTNVTRLSEQLELVKQQIMDARVGRMESLTEDVDANKRKGIATKALASIGPLFSDLFNLGFDEDNWNNTAEIKKAWNRVESDLASRRAKLTQALDSEQQLLQEKMVAAPKLLNNAIRGGLESQLQDSRRNVEDTLADTPEKQAMLEYRREMAEMAKNYESDLSTAIQQSNGDLTMQQNLMFDINETYGKLAKNRKLIQQKIMSDLAAQKKVEPEFQPKRLSPSGPLSTIFAGSDQVFATPMEKQLTVLRQIAKNTKQKPGTQVEIVK